MLCSTPWSLRRSPLGAAALPTLSKDTLGSNRVGLGLAAVVIYEQQKWRAGVVLQNGWSLGARINQFNEFSAQSTFNHNYMDGWNLYSNSSITADWRINSSDRWTVPLGLGKVLMIGKQSGSNTFQAVSNVERPVRVAFSLDFTRDRPTLWHCRQTSRSRTSGRSSSVTTRRGP